MKTESSRPLVIEMELLTGRYVATSHDRRDSAEWPPHPARLYSALVAGWGNQGQEPDERGVLVALESLGPAVIEASDADERLGASGRMVDHYVPVNDPSVTFDQSRQYEKVGAALEALESAEVGSKQHDRATVKLDAARDVFARIDEAGRTNPQTAHALLDRPKQARTYPSVTPHDPIVRFSWPSHSLTSDQFEVLDAMLERVTRVGHSSSMVSCRVVDGAELRESARRFVPESTGDRLIRNVGPGQLDALEAEFTRHRGTLPRSLPATSHRYRVVETRSTDGPPNLRPMTSGPTVFCEFEPGSRRMPSASVVRVAKALRGAVMSHADDPLSELFSGHRPDGRRTERPHLAFVPIPNVAGPYADGRLVGAAVCLPFGLAREEERSLFDEVAGALGRWMESVGAGNRPGIGRLTLGDVGVLEVTLAHDRGALHSNQRRTWARAANTWITATPIALPVHPGRRSRPGKGSHSDRIRSSIVAACEHVGLPEPRVVFASRQPLLAGTEPAGDYPAFRQPDRKHDGRLIARHLVHARVEFDRPVAGPLLLGAGRYLGLGLMRPLRVQDDGPWPS